MVILLLLLRNIVVSTAPGKHIGDVQLSDVDRKNVKNAKTVMMILQCFVSCVVGNKSRVIECLQNVENYSNLVCVHYIS